LILDLDNVYYQIVFNDSTNKAAMQGTIKLRFDCDKFDKFTQLCYIISIPEAETERALALFT